MSLAPGADPVDIEGAAEVVAVFGRAGPPTLARGLTGLAASRLRAVLLMVEIAIVGEKKLPTVFAFSLSDAMDHDPTLLGPMIRISRQNGEEKGKEKRREEEGRTF